MLARRVRLGATVVPVLATLVLGVAPAAHAGTPVPASDLSISVETTTASVGLGDRIEFAISVENRGPNAGGGTLKLKWTIGLPYLSEQRTAIGGCVLRAPPALGASCPIDALDQSGTATMTLAMNATAPFDQTLRVSVQGTNQDPNPADNHDSVTVRVLGPLAGPTVTPAVVRPGLSPSPTPSTTPSPTPSPIPSGGIQTGGGGTAGAPSVLPTVALSTGAAAAGALWLAQRQRQRRRRREGARAETLLH